MRIVRRYPYAPSPWHTQANLPVQMQQLPMELLRRDMTTRAPNIMKAVLAARQMFNPFAILPRKYGPYTDGAVGGVTAVYDADQSLAQMQAYVLQQVGAPAPDAPPEVRLSYVMGTSFQTDLPASMPPTSGIGLPPAAEMGAARLRHLPAREGYVRPDAQLYDALAEASDNAMDARFQEGCR